MKNFKLLLTGMLALTIVFTSCKKENYSENTDESSNTSGLKGEFSNDELEILSKLGKNHHISIDEAKEIANNVMDLFDFENSLKSTKAINRSISNARTIWFKPKISQLKSGNTEPKDSLALYVFNFADGSNDSLGYAIVSGDNRFQSVLGCSDAGTLNDTVSNSGLTVFLSLAPDYIENKIVEYKLKEQKVLNSAIEKLNAQLPESIRGQLEQQEPSDLKSANEYWECTDFNYGEWEKVQHGPLLTTTWGQYYPFNSNVPFTCSVNEDGHAPVGCQATAAAQIMAFHRHPASFDGVTYDWANMTSFPLGWDVPTEAKNQIAILFAEIGQNMGMKYSCDGSSASNRLAEGCYNTMGYLTDGVQGYNPSTVVSSLLRNCPVHITGYAFKGTKGWWIFKKTYYLDGHAWVIDGCLKRKRLVSYTHNFVQDNRIVTSNPASYYEYEEYLHCNYGNFGGFGNGFYVSGVFDTNKEPTLKSGEPGIYQYNIEIIPNIRPNYY